MSLHFVKYLYTEYEWVSVFLRHLVCSSGHIVKSADVGWKT